MPKTPAREQQTKRRTRRSLANPRPREDDDFSFADNSMPSNRVPKGDMTIKKDAPKLDMVRPAWNGKTGTTIRPLPCFDVHNTEEDVLLPARRSAKEDDMSDWIRGYPAAKYVGLEDKFTFLLYDPRAERRGEYSRASNPYVIFQRAIEDANSSGEAMIGSRDVMTAKWAPLTNHRSQKFAIKRPDYLYFMQALVYQHDGEILLSGGLPKGLGDNDAPQVLELSKSAVNTMMALLRQQNEGVFDDDDMSQFVYPDVCSLSDGFYITFYNPEKHMVSRNDKDASEPEEEEEEEMELGEDGGEEADNKQQARRGGWECMISDTFRFQTERGWKKPKRDLTAKADLIMDRIYWWQNVLHVPCHEELARLVASAFRGMPDLLYYAWQHNSEFFTDEVKGVLKARTQGAGAEVPSLDDDDEYVPPNRRQSRASAALPSTDSFVEDADDEEEGDNYELDDDQVDGGSEANEGLAKATAARSERRKKAVSGEKKAVPGKRTKRRKKSKRRSADA